MKIRTVAAVMALACFALSIDSLDAQDGGLNHNLFSQYTTQGQGSATAGMYPAPHYVPREVGHTHYTYQPLMPHEMMHAHSKNYYNYYGGADMFYRNKYGCSGGGSGLNKTTVVWQNGSNHMAPLPGNMLPFADLHYKMAAYKYCLKAGGGASCNRFLGGGHFGGHLRGKFGCASGQCDSYEDGGSYGEEVYDAGGYGSEVYDAPGSSCSSGGCSAARPSQTIDR